MKLAFEVHLQVLVTCVMLIVKEDGRATILRTLHCWKAT